MNTITRTRPFPRATPTGSARLLNATDPGLAAHQAHFGPLPTLEGPEDLVEMLTQSGLTGRGGAGFPTGRKLATVRAAARACPARPAVVIANGAEGEPASSKDAVLLRSAPHLVLDGLTLAAGAVGAVQCYLYAPAARLAVLHRAIQERAAAGWGAGIPAPILIEAPEHFLAGEESAAVNAVQGRAAIPSDRTVRVSTCGVHRAPTLVQNVETLAHLALIARFGPQWFRSAGLPAEPGTRLVTVSGAVPHGGVIEVVTGIPVHELLTRAGAIPAEVRAVLIGGYHGTWVPAVELPHLQLSRESLQPCGASPGAGVVQVLGRGECGLTRSAEIATWLGEHSAGQCGPCLNGLPLMAQVLTRLARGEPDPHLPKQVARLASLVEGRGSCRHPDGTARMVRSALATFATDVALHLAGSCETFSGGTR